MNPFERSTPDLDAYHERARSGPCFVRGLVSRDPDLAAHHIVYEDEDAIAFFNRWSTRCGYTLVAPEEHREQATEVFTVEDCLDLQRVVHRVAEVVREEVGVERIYILSLGSKGGNANVRWHVLPLPPGTPYGEEQFAAVMLETAGALKIPEGEKAPLALRLGRRMSRV